MKYTSMEVDPPLFRVRSMCRVLKVPSRRFYTWLKRPLSNRDQQDHRQMVMLKESWEESGKVYGYRKLHRA